MLRTEILISVLFYIRYNKINCIREHKSYLEIEEIYERVEGREIKLSISKKMQEKYKVNSFNFLIPKKLEKLINLEGIKMIRIDKIIIDWKQKL